MNLAVRMGLTVTCVMDGKNFNIIPMPTRPTNACNRNAGKENARPTTPRSRNVSLSKISQADVSSTWPGIE